MKLSIEDFNENELTSEEQNSITGGSQGKTMSMNSSCDPDGGIGDIWFTTTWY